VTATKIEGFCAPGFEAVRDAFAANFAAGREVGASFAATRDGVAVVDLWGGFADAARTRPWQRDTVVNVFSTTKAMTALCAHVLADRGLLDLDAPVARLWPEFAQAGKAALPVHLVLSHRAGLAAFHESLPIEALYDWRRMTDALAAETPWWEPGTDAGYHAVTFGHLVGELVRRASGKTLGAFLRDEVAGPLAADFQIGLPVADDARAADLVPATPDEIAAAGGRGQPEPDSLLGRIMGNPPLAPETANTRAWRAAEIPAANGHGNARSVARILAALACGGSLDGVRLLGRDALERSIAQQWQGRDLVLGMPMRWGLGFMLASETLPLGSSLRTFGHGGWGGSLGVADPDARVSWSYVMNKMSVGTTGDTRAAGPVAALYAAVTAGGSSS
jgi:CubicO group peptidase (beta-lactamase class C family)